MGFRGESIPVKPGNEAVAVRQLGWAASGLPRVAANRLRAQVREYAATVVSHDWPEMERGTLDDRTEQALAAMSTFLPGSTPRVTPPSPPSSTRWPRSAR